MSRLKRRRPPTLRQLLPNLVTVFIICAGLTSVRFAMDEKYGFALLLIVLAAVLDAADGKLARMLDSVSPIGAELDSLADFFNFGIAPGLLIYFALFDGTEHANLGWISVLTLAVCCALRLARFNVALDHDDQPTWKKAYFVGVPAPALGCLALLPMFFVMLGVNDIKDYLVPVFIYLEIIGLLAVSTVPTLSIKYLRIPQEHYLLVLLACAAFVVCLVVYTWKTLIAGCFLYLLSILVTSYFYYREAQRHEGVSDSGKP